MMKGEFSSWWNLEKEYVCFSDEDANVKAAKVCSFVPGAEIANCYDADLLLDAMEIFR